MELNGGLAILIGALLLIGGVVFGLAINKTEVVEVEKIVEVPIEVVSDCPAVEEASCPETDFLGLAIEDLLNHLEDKDLLECGGNEYNLDEVKVSRTYDDWSIGYSEDGYTVSGKVKLSFKQEDESRCMAKYNFSVFYEEGEDPEVEYVLA